MAINHLFRTAVGGVFGAGLAYLADPESSESPMTVMTGAILLGQAISWLPCLVSRCFTRSAPKEQPQVIHVSDPTHEENDPDLLQAIEASRISALSHEDQMKLALRQSLEEGDEKSDFKVHSDKELARALALSLRHEQVKICSLQRIYNANNEGDPYEDSEIIPDGFEIEGPNGSYYHAGNLVMGLLSKDQKPGEFKDPFGKGVTEDQLTLLANMMGIRADLFLNIWLLAQLDQDSEHINPETQANLKTDYRYKCLKELLEFAGDQGRKFIEFFKAKQIQAFQ